MELYSYLNIFRDSNPVMPQPTGLFKRIPAPADLLLPVLLALIPAMWLFQHFPQELKSIQNGMLGAAGMEGVDVGLRINRFYYAGMLLAAGLMGWSFLYQKCIAAKRVANRLRVQLSIASATALGCLLFQGIAGAGTFSLFYAFSLVAVLLAGMGLLRGPAWRLSWPALAGSWMLGWSITILFMDLGHIAGHSLNHTWIAGAMIAALCQWCLSGWDSSLQLRLLKVVSPLLLIPCLYTFGSEVFLILNQRGIYLTTPTAFYLLGLTGLLVWSFLRWKNQTVWPAKKLVTAMAGYTALGILLTVYYSPLLTELATEHFEMANRANAIMQLFRFHQVPFAAYYSSHLLDDQVPGILYTLLNGYKSNLDFLVYHAFVAVAYGMLTWWFFRVVFGDALLALFLIVIFPFATALVPPYCSVAFLVWMAMLAYVKQPSVRSFLWMCAAGLLLMLWRLDVAVGALPAIVLLVLAEVYRTRRWKAFFRETGIAIWVFGVPIAVLAMYCNTVLNIPLARNLGDALGYIKASQAHALPNVFVGSAFWQSMLYYAFPVVVMGLLYLAWWRKGQTGRRQVPFQALCFLGLYYLLSFQRGLVRHIFGIEGSDSFLVSFLLLILALGWYAFSRHFTWKKWTLVAAMFVLVAAFKYPDVPAIEMPAETALQTASHRSEVPNVHEPLIRAGGYKKITTAFEGIRKMMDSNFVAGATFLDMSHTPMLYYYLQRQVPGYFCQYMQNMVTDSTQRHNLLQLAAMDVPLVVYSSWPQDGFWDHVDGLNNAVRYYVMSNYIFNHYRPLGVADGKYLWLKNGITLQHNYTEPLPDSAIFAAREDNLGKLPMYWARGRKQDKQGIALEYESARNGWVLPALVDKTNGNYLLLELNNTNADWKEMTCAFADSTGARGTFLLKVAPGEAETYLVPLSTHYNWHALPGIGKIRLQSLPEGVQMKKVTLYNRL